MQKNKVMQLDISVGNLNHQYLPQCLDADHLTGY